VLRFQFRLQRVLEYRERREAAAEDAYRGAQARRIAAEAERDGFVRRRREALETARHPSRTAVAGRMALERFLERLDDEERAHEVVIALLAQEEAAARQAWLDRRAEAEAMRKLRQRAWERWRLESDRAEQSFLDEFALRSRGAA